MEFNAVNIFLLIVTFTSIIYLLALVFAFLTRDKNKKAQGLEE